MSRRWRRAFGSLPAKTTGRSPAGGSPAWCSLAPTAGGAARTSITAFRPLCFRPAKRSVVNANEIAGLLKPPTRHCNAPGVVRAGAAVAAPPRDLPTYKYRRGVLPLGQVMRDDQLITVGMNVDEFFFGGLFGRSRFGKTELALVRSLVASGSSTRGAETVEVLVGGPGCIDDRHTRIGVRRTLDAHRHKHGGPAAAHLVLDAYARVMLPERVSRTKRNYAGQDRAPCQRR